MIYVKLLQVINYNTYGKEKKIRGFLRFYKKLDTNKIIQPSKFRCSKCKLALCGAIK